ncbi:alanine and glycine-rich protein-like [Panicum hallii]|jgi:hypothetical protein|uniref:alanine and glycine-rich protein-like n=1 Tax=Panicum hallii TaxID=206008 RepID=UPI000DF4D889|nr:alanine and glycine-rich protein-like [Panicum hallii]
MKVEARGWGTWSGGRGTGAAPAAWMTRLEEVRSAVSSRATARQLRRGAGTGTGGGSGGGGGVVQMSRRGRSAGGVDDEAGRGAADDKFEGVGMAAARGRGLWDRRRQWWRGLGGMEIEARARHRRHG